MEIKLPRLGEKSDVGTVVNVLVAVGDKISKGQSVVEIETEKAIVPVPSPVAGVVTQIHVKEGDEVRVGQTLISVSAEGAVDSPAPSESRQASKPSPMPMQDTPTVDRDHRPPSGFPPPASPTIRRMARQLGIDLSRVAGSERGGRIVVDDLKNYIQGLQQGGAPAPQGAGKREASAVDRIDFSQWGPVHKQRISSLRRTIAERMQDSWVTIPHVTQFDEADVSRLMALRKQYSTPYKEKGARLTPTPFILMALVQALRKLPIFNSSLDESTGEIVYKDYYHLNVAVDTESGLIAPVLRDVDKKSLFVLAQELENLAERTRKRKIGLEELQGGTFTLSNLGSIGGTHFSPIISKPQVAVLGIGRAVTRAISRNGQWEKGIMLPLAVSYDHRLVDGANGARFIREVASALESAREEDVRI